MDILFFYFGIFLSAFIVGFVAAKIKHWAKYPVLILLPFICLWGALTITAVQQPETASPLAVITYVTVGIPAAVVAVLVCIHFSQRNAIKNTTKNA